MSLADKIAERNEKQFDGDRTEVDELGIPIPTPETPMYFVARAIRLDYLAHETEPAVHRLHTREGRLYEGRVEVRETKPEFYRLAQPRRQVKDWETAAFWHLIKKYIPKLSRRYLEVAEGVYWDIKEARIVDARDEALPHLWGD